MAEPRNLCPSPDGEWVGFTSTDGNLYKVSLLGGTPQQLVNPMDNLLGCFWAKDNVIYFSMNGKLHGIPTNGGKPEAVNITTEYSEWNQSWPYGLPDGKHLLFTVTQSTVNGGHTALLFLDTGKTRILIQNAYNARYVPTGHIVFMRSGSLWAVPFDAEQLKTTGPEVPVIDGVETHTNSGIAGYTVSDDGLMMYLPGNELTGVMGGGAQLGLDWVDRKGNETRIGELKVSQALGGPRLSLDGRQVAVGVAGKSGTDIWTYDFDRGTFSRRTFTGNAAFAIWTPDGKRLVYGHAGGTPGISWTRADGSGQPELLIKSTSQFYPNDFTPDMSQMVFTNLVSSNKFEIHVMSMEGDHAQKPLIASDFVETQPILSPDGHWLAYISTETGHDEVYVRPFPDVNNGKWQISAGGGMEPHWRRDGKELFYALGQYVKGKIEGIAAVAIDTTSGFQAGKPETLFTGNYALGLNRSYDVTPDGQRFIMLKQTAKTSDNIEAQLTSLVMVDNWFTELKRLASSSSEK